MKPIRFATALAVAGCAASLLACTTYPVETDYDPQVAFSELRSYAWLDVGREKTGDPRIDSDLLDGRVRRAVETVLGSRGYAKVDPGSEDFAITYHVGVERQLDVQTYVDSYAYGYRWHPGPAHSYTTVREYDVGSLMLDIVNPVEKLLIWRGVTQARIDLDGTPEEREARIFAAVGAILAKFPPQ